MKYFKGIFIVMFTSLILSSCSNIKVLASWKADNASDIRDNNLLVIARTANEEARVAFENEIVKSLKLKGINATPSLEVLPENIDLFKKPTEEGKDAFRDFLASQGFDGIILSSIKSKDETSKTYKDGGYYAGASVPFYPQFYTGFYTYYYHPMSYASSGVYVEPSLTTYSYQSYVLETVAYDFTKNEGERLIAVVTSIIENPQDMSRNAELYTKKITKALK